MFSEKEIQEYKSKKAPKELEFMVKSKFAEERKPKRWIKAAVAYASAAAACILCVIVVSLFMENRQADITLNGQTLEGSLLFYDISPASDMRSSPNFSIPMEIDPKGEAQIKVSYGAVVLSDGTSKKTLDISEKTELCWEIARDKSLPECILAIDTGDSITKITLTYDYEKNAIKAEKTVD